MKRRNDVDVAVTLDEVQDCCNLLLVVLEIGFGERLIMALSSTLDDLLELKRKRMKKELFCETYSKLKILEEPKCKMK
jgi:hypothetical protein